MDYVFRDITAQITQILERQKSLILFGARQTGKTTLIKHLPHDLYLSFMLPRTRLRYEQTPDLLFDELKDLFAKTKKRNLIVLDEVQKVPILMDVIQECIDNELASFIITGSSARKLKKPGKINLLPGRVISKTLYPFSLHETFPSLITRIEDLLLFGSLPGIFNIPDIKDKELELENYVNVYLEEEIRQEAFVRNVAIFSRFLELAAIESGKIINFSSLSQDVGISYKTIETYFDILEDCLIVEKIEPLISTHTRRKLTKSPKYLFMDLGIRRICAKEGAQLNETRLGELFEQWVGIELIKIKQNESKNFRLFFWRDHAGPEVDWVIEQQGAFIPIEVKFSTQPSLRDAKHLLSFMDEYNCERGYILSRTLRAYTLTDKITVLPWQELNRIF